MSIFDKVREAVESGRKLFGADHDMVIARAPMYGNDDVCLLIYGEQHQLAARVVASKCGPAVKVKVENSCAWRDRPARSYSVVEFPVEVSA